VTDNACGAVARMISKNTAAVPLDQVLPVLVGALPLKKDYAEYEPVFECLLGLAQSAHPLLGAHIPAIVQLMGHVLSTPKTLGEKACGHVSSLLKLIAGSDRSGLEAVMANLQKEHQAAIFTALNTVL
jgi:hypothetical protein